VLRIQLGQRIDTFAHLGRAGPVPVAAGAIDAGCHHAGTAQVFQQGVGGTLAYIEALGQHVAVPFLRRVGAQ